MNWLSGRLNKDKTPRAKSGTRRIDAYADLLEDAPAEHHTARPQPPAASGPKMALPQNPQQQAEFIGLLLDGKADKLRQVVADTPAETPADAPTAQPAPHPQSDLPPPASQAAPPSASQIAPPPAPGQTTPPPAPGQITPPPAPGYTPPPAQTPPPDHAHAPPALIPPEPLAPPRSQMKLDQGRIRLTIAIPQTPSDSWIGGCPSLPQGMDWPKIAGRPASFFAQIALADLPDDIWGGMGPRHGWLLFFGADDPGNEVVVLHSPERGQDRPLPEGADYYFACQSGEEALAELIGPEALQPPRWYLAASPDATSARPDLETPYGLEPLLDKARMTTPAFLPFDWPTAFALLDCCDALLRGLLARGKTRSDAGDASELPRQKARLTTLQRLRKISQATEARAAERDFDQKECARLIGQLVKLTNQGWQSARAEALGRKPASLLQMPGFADYRRLFEAQARRCYAADPTSLPEPTRTLLEPIWADQADIESIFIGQAPGEDLPFDGACLLMLPSSVLAGWQIGDLSRWAVQIDPRDLAMGAFDKARGQNSEGQEWDSLSRTTPNSDTGDQGWDGPTAENTAPRHPPGTDPSIAAE